MMERPYSRLAAPRFAHDPDRLTLGDAEGDPIHGHDLGPSQVELGAQVDDLHDARHTREPSRPIWRQECGNSPLT